MMEKIIDSVTPLAKCECGHHFRCSENEVIKCSVCGRKWILRVFLEKIIQEKEKGWAQ